MKINDSMITDYLSGRDISTYKDKWYFNSSMVAGDMGRNIFVQPEESNELKEKIEEVYRKLLEASKVFTPLNQDIWDALFPNWKEVLKEVQVDLILGFPEPYDATTEYDEQGVCHIIFDLVCWSKYIKYDISSLSKNLLTHELCHVLIGKTIPCIDEDYKSSDYMTALDALTFHEAFAHLVSYQSSEIDQVNWQDEKLIEVRKQSNAEMRKALVEKELKKQKDYLYRAQCGSNYYDKYACMCGLLYLAQLWENGGIPALRACFMDGYHEFADKCSRE